jgi:hypothetical protein
MGKPYLKIIFLKGSQDKETQMKRISHDLYLGGFKVKYGNSCEIRLPGSEVYNNLHNQCLAINSKVVSSTQTYLYAHYCNREIRCLNVKHAQPFWYKMNKIVWFAVKCKNRNYIYQL